jgi:hypothetical protein
VDNEPDSHIGKRVMPLICGECEGGPVVQLQQAGRILIRCEACGARLFSYYLDPQRREREGEPPAEGDPLLIRQVERELLRQVSQPAQALYEYLRRYRGRYGYAPTLREMQREMHWRSVNAVRHHLQQLEAAGLIERDYATARGIRLVMAA